ncbi:DUF4249 domain-containing protein [bacterium]|nr:DUF4249 domain-containing protein [bacterium]
MKKFTAHSTFSLLLPALALLLLSACEDTPPTEYDPAPFLEAYLIVDEPIEGIVVAISQPITEAFTYQNMIVTDANVVLTEGDNTYTLQYVVEDGRGSYRYPDSTVKVLPATPYRIRVSLQDGTVMTAETVTPERIAWVTPPREVLQYPQDTTRLVSPDSLRIDWTPGNSVEYIVRVRALDTLGYGKYLTPPTEEINGRTNNIPFEEPDDPTFYTLTRWGFVQTSDAPTVWAAFRWYGRNDVSILAPDTPMLEWFKATQWGGRSVQYRDQFSNVQGGLGILASASVVSQEVFVLKRKKQ